MLNALLSMTVTYITVFWVISHRNTPKKTNSHVTLGSDFEHRPHKIDKIESVPNGFFLSLAVRSERRCAKLAPPLLGTEKPDSTPQRIIPIDSAIITEKWWQCLGVQVQFLLLVCPTTMVSTRRTGRLQQQQLATFGK